MSSSTSPRRPSRPLGLFVSGPETASADGGYTPDLFGPLGLDLDNRCGSCGAPDAAPYCEECS